MIYITTLLLMVFIGANLHQKSGESSPDGKSSVVFRSGDSYTMHSTWTGVVSAVEGERALISGGSRQGLAAGMLLDVLARGKWLVDPETGLTVGSVTEKIGQLRVVDVEQHVFEATIVKGCENLEPGARVELRP